MRSVIRNLRAAIQNPQNYTARSNLMWAATMAENLEAGIRIQRAGRYAFRLVTLEGDVMHSGVSQSGNLILLFAMPIFLQFCAQPRCFP